MRNERPSRDRSPGPWLYGCLGLGVCLLGIAAAIGGIVAYEMKVEAAPRAIDLAQEVPYSSGRVVLDIEGVTLTLSAGAPGSPIRLEGRHDAARLRLVTAYTPEPDGWVYRVELRGRGLINPQLSRDTPLNELRIVLPRDVPLSLEAGLSNSETRLELGGLWLLDADLALRAGRYDVAFAEPLREPLEHLDVLAPISEIELAGLGNASPRHLRVEKKLGPARIDLGGRWSRDAVIELDCGLGSCELIGPGSNEAVLRADATPPTDRADLPVLRVLRAGADGTDPR